MKETHYTPTIEEFHVGFEYEQKPYYYENQAYGDFKPSILSNAGTIQWIELELKAGNVRVKRLHKDDIVSLRWVFQKLEDNGVMRFTFYDRGINLELYYDTGTKLTRIKLDHSDYGQIYFEGMIKNKSELIKIMKMIKCEPVKDIN